jgi:DNA repair ATPase RecN
MSTHALQQIVMTGVGIQQMFLVQYQLKELNEFAPQAGEYEQIDEEYKRLANSGQLLSDCYRRYPRAVEAPADWSTTAVRCLPAACTLRQSAERAERVCAAGW